MIYDNIVRQYEASRSNWGGGGSRLNTVNEGDYVLKVLNDEKKLYGTLLEDTSLSYQQREILEAKYEVIQEAVGAAIIAAVIAAVGALILLIVKVLKSTGSASNTVKTKIKEVNKKLEDKIDEIKAQPNSYEGELGDDGLTDAQRDATAKALDKFDDENKFSDEDLSNFDKKFGKRKDSSNDKKEEPKTFNREEKRNATYEIIKGYVDERDTGKIKYTLANSLDTDPTFLSYEKGFSYLMKNFPDFFVDDDGKFKFVNNPEDWDDDYWNSLKLAFTNNYSLKKFNHMRSVAHVFYKNKKNRLHKARGDKPSRSELTQELKARNTFTIELKKSIKKHTILKEIFDNYKDRFDKICEDCFDNSFPGFSGMDLLKDVNIECIREFERDTRIAAMDNKDFSEYDDIKTVTYDFKNRYETDNKKYVEKHMSADNMEDYSGQLAETLKNDTIEIIFKNRSKMDFTKQQRENNKDALTYIYDSYKSSVETKASEKMNWNINYYLEEDIENKTNKALDKLSKDLKKLEETLKRLKQTNFNKSKVDDNNKTSENKQNSDNYLQNMLYIDKYAVKILSSFVTGIHNLEIKRMSFVSQYWACYTRCVSNYVDINFGGQNDSPKNVVNAKGFKRQMNK